MAQANARCLMYLTGQHYDVPSKALLSEITHVALAFMPSTIFNEEQAPSTWPLFTTVEKVRSQFPPGITIMIAIGGWGDTAGFSTATATEESRQLFANNIKAMLDSTGADGVDIDWEYPGGNGEDYKTVPNSQKAWEISSYPLLLSTIRQTVGPTPILSAAVPGLIRDMLAFTPSTIPSIMSSLNFLNIMTYDLMNRRDNGTKHHTGISLSLETIDTYLAMGVLPKDANLGFGFYVKWFKVPKWGCKKEPPVGCETGLMEDPDTGADLGKAGQFSWIDEVPGDLKKSFEKAMKKGKYDEEGGGHYFYDVEEGIWWNWDTPEAIKKKFPRIVREKGLGGVFVWGLGEDSKDWRHLKALNERVRDLRGGKDEL